MTRLISIEAVRTRINFDQIADIDAVIGSILDKINPSLEVSLRTKFEGGSFTDKFFVQDSLSFGGALRRELRLSRGLVSGITTIKTAGRLKDFATTGTDISDYATLIDEEKGIVLIADYDLTGLYVQVEYDAGLTPGTDGVYQDVPDWLQELAVLRTVITLDSIHPTIRFNDPLNATPDRMNALAGDILEQHIRYVPRALDPL